MSSFKILITLTLVIFGLFFFTASAFAATYYVSTTGSNNNPGTSGAPFLTIQKAADTAQAGDTVYIKGGTYNERIVLPRSGSSGAYITFQNAPGETAILDGTDLGNGKMVSGSNLSWIKIIGLKIGNHMGAGVLLQGQGSHIEIRNNEIFNQSFDPNYQVTGGYGHAIAMATWPWDSTNTYSDVVIDGNYIHDVVTGIDYIFNEALTLGGNFIRFQITNNVIERARYIGIDLIGKGSQYPRNGIISGNTVRNSGYDGSTAGIYIDGAKNVVIQNNKVHNQIGHGIFPGNEDTTNSTLNPNPPVVADNILVRWNEAWNNSTNISIGGGGVPGEHPIGYSEGTYFAGTKNCRVVHNVSYLGTYFLGAGTGHLAKNNIGYNGPQAYVVSHGWNQPYDTTVLDYNLYYPANAYYWYGDNNTIYSPFSAYQSATNQDLHGIAADPLFKNAGSHDFTLNDNSPAIDKGDFLTRTTSSCSDSNVVTVQDAKYFIDGYGISGFSGDAIQIGSQTAVVTSVNYDTNQITLDRNLTWTSGAGVSYPFYGSAPDMGAYESTVGGTTPSDTTPPSAPANVVVQ